jgi:hypothetical protein
VTGGEAVDAEGLTMHRKRISVGRNFEALEFAESLGITVAARLAWPASGAWLGAGKRLGGVVTHRQE